ncbi:MAG: RHS repeat protein [Nevskiaceae bacterium]|nr:MAG: RHS repeat protein [Nevskiaceae bacterium]TBR74594.1 MAG: RHS repeat protein [Nevskiaceae bacterium]
MKGATRSASAVFSVLILACGMPFTLPAWATSYAVQPGDTVIVTGVYASSDPDELSENEPLAVNAGPCSFTTVSSHSCRVQITAAGTFDVTYSIIGGDGDENPGVYVDIIHVPAQPCPVGTGGFGNACTPQPVDDAKNNTANTCNGAMGDPIFPGDGNVHEEVTDFNGPGLLKLARSYNSRTGWLHSFLMHLIVNGTTVQALRPDGTAYTFTSAGSAFTQDPDVNFRLTQLPAGSPGGAAYRLVTDQDAVELYDANGLPLSVTARGGASVHMTYAGSLLSRVTDVYGRSLDFSYDSHNRVSGFTTPAGESYRYGYDGNGRLTQINAPDGTSTQYVYEDAAYPFLLTGIIDPRGNRTATWTYDTLGRAVGVTGAGGTGSYQVAYPTGGSSAVQVTDPLGTVRSLDYGTVYGRLLLTSSDQACPSYGRDVASKAIDINGNVVGITDYKGVSTTLGYDDSRNLVTTLTRAAGAPASERTTIQYSPDFRLPTTIQTANQLDQRSYDAAGNLIQRTLADIGAQATRTTQASYDGNGQLLTYTDADGNVTTYTYDGGGNLASVTNALGQVTAYTHDADGRLLSQTDANSLVTAYTYDPLGRITSRTLGTQKTAYGYDAAGNLVSTAQPNGFALTMTYDAANRLTGIADIFGDRLAFTLDALGDRTSAKIYNPSGALVYTHARTYDALGRLQQDIGAQGQTTAYTYDANSNLASIADPLNHVTAHAYDALNRLSQVTDADNGVTNYTYNALDQLTSVTDPRGLKTTYWTNALGDVTRTQSPDHGTTTATYDAAGALLSRIDAMGQTTQYQYDALNRLTQIAYSVGTTIGYSYDQGANGIGRLTGMTDGAGSTAWTYDAYGHVLQKTQQSEIINGQNLTTGYGYDGAGQLTDIVYPSGSHYTYGWTQGRVTTVTLLGKTVLGIHLNDQVLADHIAYRPFDGPRAWTFGNGESVTRTYDLDGRLATYGLGTLGYDAAGRITRLTQGGASILTGSKTWTYDALDRLASYGNGSTTIAYGYDANGNRVAQSGAGVDASYGIDPSSNRISTITPGSGTPLTYAYDADGNVTYDGINDYGYNVAGQLTSTGTTTNLLNATGQMAIADADAIGAVLQQIETSNIGNLPGAVAQLAAVVTGSDTQGALAQIAAFRLALYTYNGLGQRSIKIVATTGLSPPTSVADFAYDEADHLIGEYGIVGNLTSGIANLLKQPSGPAINTIQETVWLGDIPLATIQNGLPYYIHSDQLGTPRQVDDSLRLAVWAWDTRGFGDHAPAANPGNSLLGLAFRYNPRFPGQYADAESGLFHNDFRDYNPTTGRYVQTDPIGLAGGINPYAYVGGNPVSLIDPLGLSPCGCQSVASDFVQSFKNDFNATNHFFFSFPTSLSKTAIGIGLGSANVVADATGGVTLFQALGSIPGGGLAFYGGVGGTLLAGGIGFAANSVAVTSSLEAGITAGSLLNAAVQTTVNQFSCH